MQMRFNRDHLSVERIGTALWLGFGGHGTLIDCPDGTGAVVQGRSLRRVWITNGRLERVCGLPGLLARCAPAELCFPLSDERGALLVEAWQRGWNGQIVLDAIQPGNQVVHDGIAVSTQPLRAASPAIGLRWNHPEAVVVYLPRCTIDGAARKLCRGASLVVLEPGVEGIERLQLGGAQVWVTPMAMA